MAQATIHPSIYSSGGLWAVLVAVHHAVRPPWWYFDAMASAYQAKSLYDFDSKDKRLLSFKQDEKFIVIEQLCKDPNWYYAVSEKGAAGFVPVTYIVRDEVGGCHFLTKHFCDRLAVPIHYQFV